MHEEFDVVALKELSAQYIEQALDTLLQAAYLTCSQLETTSISCVQLCIDAPDNTLMWQGSKGSIAFKSSDIVSSSHPMRIASISKTFVAAAILRLWEQQRLKLDVGIDCYISVAHQNLLLSHGYQPELITIKHLLSHTSGLFDYADSDAFYTQVTTTPNRYWTRTEQLFLAMESGNPYGRPGDVYRYSDTGFILLGEIIEQVHGQSLGLALRELIDYQRLGLKSTWLETVEPPPEGTLPRIHQYVDDDDFYTVNGSCDIYGGGGLISTIGDMTRFMRALFTHQVYDNPATLRTMLTTVNATRGGPPAYSGTQQIPGTYRLGIDIDLGGKVFLHSGFYGTYAGYIPSRDVAFSFSVNQHFARPYSRQLLAGIYRIFGVEE